MRKLIYLFVIIIFISCSKENDPKELLSTTDITCFFAYNNNQSKSKNITMYKANTYEGNYSFSNKILYIIITSNINNPKAESIINKIIIDPSEPSINDGITLHGLYTGNNTITIRIKSSDRVYSKLYTPNSLGELVIKDTDIIPVYKNLEKENVFITPDCSLYFGVFKPYNTATKFIFSKETDEDIQYRYRFINVTSKKQIGFCEKNGKKASGTHLILSKEMKKGGVIINEENLSKIEIICEGRKPGFNKYNTIGVKTFKLVPGECLVKRFTEVDFINE